MEDGKISPNFKLSEFTCECCGVGIPEGKLVDLLESIRFVFTERMSPAKVSVVISGRLRCKKHAIELQEKGIGVGITSRHVFPDYADGVDIKLYSNVNGHKIQVNPDEVAKVARELMQGYGGVGQYKGRTHVDVRSTIANWDYR